MRSYLTRGALLLLVIAGGCRRAPPPPPFDPNAPGPGWVVNKALGVSLAGVPSGFTAAPPAADALRLTRADGSVLVLARGTGGQAGADLAAAVAAEEARIAGLPGGRYFGAVEVLCQLGRVQMTRGRYRDGGEDGAEREEIRVFAVHPRERGHSLVLSYVYPASGSGRERIDQALAVLARIRRA
jgi:hypothetical protein